MARREEVSLSQPTNHPADHPARNDRAVAAAATVAAVYRHACNDAATAAIAQDWLEWNRLLQIARSIERAYPDASSRARFPPWMI